MEEKAFVELVKALGAKEGWNPCRGDVLDLWWGFDEAGVVIDPELVTVKCIWMDNNKAYGWISINNMRRFDVTGYINKTRSQKRCYFFPYRTLRVIDAVEVPRTRDGERTVLASLGAEERAARDNHSTYYSPTKKMFAKFSDGAIYIGYKVAKGDCWAKEYLPLIDIHDLYVE